MPRPLSATELEAAFKLNEVMYFGLRLWASGHLEHFDAQEDSRWVLLTSEEQRQARAFLDSWEAQDAFDALKATGYRLNIRHSLEVSFNMDGEEVGFPVCEDGREDLTVSPLLLFLNDLGRRKFGASFGRGFPLRNCLAGQQGEGPRSPSMRYSAVPDHARTEISLCQLSVAPHLAQSAAAFQVIDEVHLDQAGRFTGALIRVLAVPGVGSIDDCVAHWSLPQFADREGASVFVFHSWVRGKGWVSMAIAGRDQTLEVQLPGCCSPQP